MGRGKAFLVILLLFALVGISMGIPSVAADGDYSTSSYQNTYYWNYYWDYINYYWNNFWYNYWYDYWYGW
jgi:hypothetical protein